MASITSFKETTTVIDETGKEQTTVKETTKSVQRSLEPDYVKLYTNMWCEFNEIPLVYRDLFLQLVIRMTYCNAQDLGHSQLVNTGKPWSDDIMQSLGWKQRMYQKGLKALCDCNAIKQVSRGVYQISPLYAGKGEWKYNPSLARGGVEDLVATFSFKDKKVETKVIWADDGTDTPINGAYREGLNVSKNNHTVLKTTTSVPESVPEGQMSITDVDPSVVNSSTPA